jgi:type II secretory pathway pseudopilin PulG
MTLGELVIVVLLIGTIAGMATPYLIEARARYRFENGAREVLRGLQLARFEAVRRNQSIEFTRLTPTRFMVEGVGEFDIPGGVEFVSGPTSIQFASFGPILEAVAPIVLSSGNRTAEIVINLSGYARLN